MGQINEMSADWLAVKAWAESERQGCIDMLIACDNAEIRGRIKQLDELLELPEKWHKEA